jgi:hypothetical protein
MKKTEAIGLVFTLFALLIVPLACTHHAVSANDSAGGSFTVPDTTPPANVTDLAVSAATTHSLTLTWTAPGDDGNNGTAAEYDIRYATSNIDNATWEFAIQASGEPAPKPAGSNETFVVGGLASATTYYFALKTGDDAGNWANLSNIAHGATMRSGGGGGGGGGGEGSTKYFTVDFLGKVTSVPMNWDGSLAVPLLATSPDATASLGIDKGTKVLDAAGKPVDEITIRTVANQPLSLLPNTTMVGNVYDVTPYNITFDKPATLTLGFSSSEVPEGALPLSMIYGSGTDWSEIEVELTSIGGLEALSAKINHTGLFTIIARMLSFSELEIGYMGQKVASGNITTDGFLMQPLEFTIQDGNGELYFSLREETRILNREGKPPAMIMIDPVTPSELPPPPSDSSAILMPFSIHPDLTIDPIMKVTIHYDEGELGDGINEEDLVLAYYDEPKEKWVPLLSKVDAEDNTVTAWTTHTSIFAVSSNIAGEFPWWWIVEGVLVIAGIALLAFLIRHRIRSRPAAKTDTSQTRLTK